MEWLSLGSVVVGEEWQAFPQECLGYEVFRLVHSTTADPFNSCFLSRYFPAPAPGGRYSPWRRIYSSNEPSIIHLPLPPELVELGVVVFSMQVKHRYPYYPVPWTIELQALI